MRRVISERNEVLISGSYDIIVVGGGIAGVSAAIAAKRNGCNVLLIEKGVMLGGLATLGYVNKYLPLCDGLGNKVCGAVCEELLYDSIKYGYNTLPEAWRTGSGDKNKRYMSEFSPYDFVIALDEKIEELGVKVLYDTLFCKPVMQGTRCEAVIVENKGGRAAFKAKAFVDATGDADLMYLACVPCKTQDNWLSSWGYVSGIEYMKKAVEKNDVSLGVHLYELGAKDTGVGGEAYPKYDGIDPWSRTDFVIAGRKLIRERMNGESDSSVTTVALPQTPQLRTTRRIVGEYEITKDDINKHNADSIGCVPDWRRRGQVYEVPFSALYSNKAENVISAGRCISSSGDSWEVTRVIPACAVTGQAAGTAAGFIAQKGCTFKGIDITLLQGWLSRDKVILHYKNAV